MQSIEIHLKNVKLFERADRAVVCGLDKRIHAGIEDPNVHMRCIPEETKANTFAFLPETYDYITAISRWDDVVVFEMKANFDVGNPHFQDALRFIASQCCATTRNRRFSTRFATPYVGEATRSVLVTKPSTGRLSVTLLTVYNPVTRLEEPLSYVFFQKRLNAPVELIGFDGHMGMGRITEPMYRHGDTGQISGEYLGQVQQAHNTHPVPFRITSVSRSAVFQHQHEWRLVLTGLRGGQGENGIFLLSIRAASADQYEITADYKGTFPSNVRVAGNVRNDIAYLVSSETEGTVYLAESYHASVEHIDLPVTSAHRRMIRRHLLGV